MTPVLGLFWDIKKQLCTIFVSQIFCIVTNHCTGWWLHPLLL